MNKKEVAEIKKQFGPQNCALTRLCTCYVDGERNRKMETREAFLFQSEEECFKYFEIFRKCLTGSIGKNLINLDFPLQAEARDGQQAILLQLLQEKLKNDDTLEAFYNRVIETYDCSGSYLICLVHGNYDIPGKNGSCRNHPLYRRVRRDPGNPNFFLVRIKQRYSNRIQHIQYQMG